MRLLILGLWVWAPCFPFKINKKGALLKLRLFFCHHLEPSKEGENQRIRPLGLNRKSDRKKLRDCFFTIPLAERDHERFAFSVPVLNNCQPLERFQWKVLPLRMLNSPAICQYFVHQAVQPVRTQFPQSVIYHDMDDLPIAAASQEELKQVYLWLWG